MLPFPSREAMATLTRAAHAVVPLYSLGIVRILNDARVSLLAADLSPRVEAAQPAPDIDFSKSTFDPLLMMLT